MFLFPRNPVLQNPHPIPVELTPLRAVGVPASFVPSSRDGSLLRPPSLLPLAGADQTAKQIVRGRDRILALQPVLRDLAALHGQHGDAGDLALFLSGPHEVRKRPVLVLSPARPGEPSVRNLKDAALLFEYTLFGSGLRILTSADATGRRTLFSAPELRASVAASAAATLIAGGAHLVHIAYRTDLDLEHDGVTIADDLGSVPRSVRWALRQQAIPLFLQLGPTFDDTLARIGQRTRSNLRYYRRRTERELGSVYQPRVQITLKEFLAFNRECMYAVPDKLATWRFQALKSVEHPLLAGMQDREGRWLSLVGGRRRLAESSGDNEVEIDWQMNRDCHRLLSLSTVLRSYLIEDEIARGSRRLYIEGGTPHPIGRSFTRDRVHELTVKQDSFYIQMLSRFAARLFPEKNYVGQLLSDPSLLWHAAGR